MQLHLFRLLPLLFSPHFWQVGWEGNGSMNDENTPQTTLTHTEQEYKDLYYTLQDDKSIGLHPEFFEKNRAIYIDAIRGVSPNTYADFMPLQLTTFFHLIAREESLQESNVTLDTLRRTRDVLIDILVDAIPSLQVHDSTNPTARYVASLFASAMRFLPKDAQQQAQQLFGPIIRGSVLDDGLVRRCFVAGATEEDLDEFMHFLVNVDGKLNAQGKKVLHSCLTLLYELRNEELNLEAEGYCSKFFAKLYTLEINRLWESQFTSDEFDDLFSSWKDNLYSTIEQNIWNSTTKNLDRLARFKWQIKNMERIYDLELHRPGSAKILYTQFGIRNFARYDLGDLIEQYDLRDDVGHDWVLAVTSVGDHNGAFASMYHKERKKADDQATTRFIEAKDPDELERFLTEMKAKYATHKKAQYGILGGHGTAKGIALSNKEDNRVSRHDILRKIGPIIASILDADGEFGKKVLILASCSTGKTDETLYPVGRTFAISGITTYAPKKDAWIRRVSFIETDDGFLEPEIMYETDTSENENDQKNEYGNYTVPAEVFRPKPPKLKPQS